MYDVLLIDPPWAYGSGGVRSGEYAELDYPTLTVADLKQLPIQPWCNPNCAMFMWVTGSFLTEALEIGAAWGFKFVRIDKVWVKKTGKGGRHGVVGPWGMTDAEYILLFVRGQMCSKQVQRNQFVVEVATYPGIHSRKPAIFRQMIEDRFPPEYKRLELFSREQAPGWTVIGNDIDGRDIREVLALDPAQYGKPKEKKMKHITSFSGGAASFTVADQLIEKYGPDDVLLVFCDTLIEDEDLYRFIVEGASKLFSISISDELLSMATSVPSITNPDRSDYLANLASLTMQEIPSFVWLRDGRDPWQVFKDRRYQGNTRVAHCTVELKGKTFAKWLTDTYQPDECVIHFGFDWSEQHRLDDARKNWAPYQCEAILCAPPYLSRSQVFQTIDDHDMETPRLYEEGFVHNNCGGFCVKAGQAHYENLLRQRPDVYAYHEAKQEELMAELPSTRPFLRMVKNKVTNYLTLKQFREHLQSGGEYQEFEYGGCGCFSDANKCGISSLLANDNDQPGVLSDEDDPANDNQPAAGASCA